MRLAPVTAAFLAVTSLALGCRTADHQPRSVARGVPPGARQSLDTKPAPDLRGPQPKELRK